MAVKAFEQIGVGSIRPFDDIGGEMTVPSFEDIGREQKLAVRPKPSMFSKIKEYVSPLGALIDPDVYKAAKMEITGTSPYPEDRYYSGEIYDRFKNMVTRVLSPVAWVVPGVTRKGLIEELNKEAEGFTGLGKAIVPAAGEVAEMATEWIAYQKAFGITHKGVEMAKGIPKVGHLLEVIEKSGGVKKFASKFPRIYAATKGGLQAFLEGEIIGQTRGALEGVEEGDILKRMNIEGAKLGAIAAGFSLVSSIDNALYIRKLRNVLVVNTKARYDAKIDTLPKGMADPRAKAFIMQEKLELQQIDNIVSAVEAQLIGMKSGKLARGAFEAVESPQKAAERIIKYGYKPGKGYTTGEPSLKKGMGKPTKRPLMPEGKVAQVKEYLSEIKAIGKQTIQEIRGVKGVPKISKLPTKPAPFGEITPTEAITEVKPAKIRMNRTNDELQKLTDVELTKEVIETPKTHVKLGAGQTEFEGMFLSTEQAGNRYEEIGRPAVSVAADIKNPKIFRSAFEYSSFKDKFIPDEIKNKIKNDEISDFEQDKIYIEAGKKATTKLKSQGYDSVYLPESKDNEGILVVFDRSKIRPFSPSVPKGQIAPEAKSAEVAPPKATIPESLVTEKPPEKPEGLTRDELNIVDTETAGMLRQAQLEGAKVGYKIGNKQAREEMKAKITTLKAGKTLTEDTRNETRKLIQDAFGTTVPKKFLTLLNQTTKKENIDTVLNTITEVIEKIDQKQALKELKTVSNDIKSRIGKTMQEKGIRPEYARKLNMLMDSFTTKKLSQWRIGDISSLKNYLSELKEGISNNPSTDENYRTKLAELLIPENRLNQLDKITKSSIHLLKANDIRTVTTELKRLVHLNNVKNKLYLGRTARDTAEYLNKSIEEQKSVRDESRIAKKETLATTRQPKSALREFYRLIAGVHNHDMKTLVFTIEGGKEGVVSNILVENIRDGRRVEADHKVKTFKYIHKTLADNNISPSDLAEFSPAFLSILRGEGGQRVRALFGRQLPTYKVKIAGKDINLTMAEMMSVYMHSQSDFNLKALLNEGVASILEEKGTLSPEELAVIVRHVKNNPKALALTKMYAHIAENIHRPAINEISMDLKGIEIADVDNYFTVERYARGKVAGNQEYQINLLESQGFLQERTGSKNPIIIRDFFTVLMANIDSVSEYVGMAKPFRAAHTILSYKEWMKAVDSKGHELQRRHLNSLMEHTEQKPKVKGVMQSLFSKVLRTVPRAVLAEPGIMVGQIMSEINYFATDIPFKYLLRNLLRNPVPSNTEVDRACEEMPWLWCRRNLGATSIETRDISRTDAVLRAFTGKKALINLPTQGINYVDMEAMTFGRIATESWVEDTTDLKRGTPEFITEVNKRYHKAASESQPMFEPENRSVLTSSPDPLVKAFVLFRSYVDQTLRILSRASTAYRNGTISLMEMSRRFGVVFAGFATYKMLRILVNALLYNQKKDLFEIVKETILSPIRALNIIGYLVEKQINRMLDITIGRKPKTRYFDVGFENLVTSTINEALDSAKDYADAVAYLGTDEVYKSGPNKGKLKSEVLLLRATEKLAYSIGKLVGLPTPLIQKARYGWTKKEEDKRLNLKSVGGKGVFRKSGQRKSIFRKAG